MHAQTTSKTVPELRFPEFSGEWEEKKLGEMDIYVSDGNYGERYPKANEMRSKGIPFIRANNIKDLKIVWNDMYFIDASLHKELREGHLKSGDILITTRGDIGSVALVTEEFNNANINAQLCLLRVKSDLSPAFLLNYLATWQTKKQFAELQTGSALKQLPKGNLAKVKLGLPKFTEQQKIASFLSSINEWIENLKKQKEELEKHKKGMMQKIFSQEIRFKDDKGKDFPDWEEKKLGDVATFLKGQGVSKADISKDGEYKCIRYGELYTHYREVITKINSKTSSKISSSIESKSGDVLIPSSGETALDIATASCLIESGVIIGGDLNILRLNENQIGEFYAYYISNCLNLKIASLAQGNSVVHLYTSHLKTLEVNIPTLEEQQKIAGFLTSLDNLIESNQQKISQAENWKKGLMQRMFV